MARRTVLVLGLVLGLTWPALAQPMSIAALLRLPFEQLLHLEIGSRALPATPDARAGARPGAPS